MNRAGASRSSGGRNNDKPKAALNITGPSAGIGVEGFGAIGVKGISDAIANGGAGVYAQRIRRPCNFR